MTWDNDVHTRAAELTELSRHLFQVAEQEKAELARELHDTFGSNLTAINMDLNWIAKRLPPERPELGERLQRVLRTLGETVELEQQLIERLRPAHLDTLGLAVAIRAECKQLTDRCGVPCEVEAKEDFDDLDTASSISLLRVAQEALANIEKHARAAFVRVRIAREGDGLRFTVIDDGVGVAEEEHRALRSHGLLCMRERMQALGGTMTLEAAEGGGTVLSAYVPLRT